jgi:hypothetical protein
MIGLDKLNLQKVWVIYILHVKFNRKDFNHNIYSKMKQNLRRIILWKYRLQDPRIPPFSVHKL